MQATIQGNGSQQLIIRQSNPCGLRFTITATTPADVDVTTLTNVTVNAQLRRNGKSITVMNGNLFALGLADSQSSADGLVVNGSFTSCYLPFSKVKRTGYLNTGVVNLRGDEELVVSVTTSSAETGQVLTFSDQQGTGVELYTPEVYVYVVNRNQSQQNCPLPQFIDGVSVVNSLEELGLISMNLQCGNPSFQAIDNASDMRSKISSSISGGQAANPTFYAWCAYEGAPLMAATLSLGVDTSATGTTYVVVYGGSTTPTVMANAARLSAKINKENRKNFMGL